MDISSVSHPRFARGSEVSSWAGKAGADADRDYQGQLLAHRLAQLKDASTAKHYHISMAKMNNAEIALAAARTARDILRGVGILNEHQCFRHMCNLESVKT